jgi:hypothetical protein
MPCLFPREERKDSGGLVRISAVILLDLRLPEQSGREVSPPNSPHPGRDVEKHPEHAGRVEARQTEPIDRPVQADLGGALPTMQWFSIGW